MASTKRQTVSSEVVHALSIGVSKIFKWSVNQPVNCFPKLTSVKYQELLAVNWLF